MNKERGREGNKNRGPISPRIVTSETHLLESVKTKTGQDTERKQGKERDSHPEEGDVKFGHSYL